LFLLAALPFAHLDKALNCAYEVDTQVVHNVDSQDAHRNPPNLLLVFHAYQVPSEALNRQEEEVSDQFIKDLSSVHALIYIGFSIDNQQQVGELDFYHNHEAFHLQVDTDRHKESSLGQEEERECTVNPTFLVLHVFIETAELHLMLFHPSDCVARYEKQVTESE